MYLAPSAYYLSQSTGPPNLGQAQQVEEHDAVPGVVCGSIRGDDGATVPSLVSGFWKCLPPVLPSPPQTMRRGLRTRTDDAAVTATDTAGGRRRT